jgi:hypothetical protein
MHPRSEALTKPTIAFASVATVARTIEPCSSRTLTTSVA